jgi:hypothetical protein
MSDEGGQQSRPARNWNEYSTAKRSDTAFCGQRGLFREATVTVAVQAEVLDPDTTERVKTSATGSWDKAVERDELGRYIEARH